MIDTSEMSVIGELTLLFAPVALVTSNRCDILRGVSIDIIWPFSSMIRRPELLTFRNQ